MDATTGNDTMNHQNGAPAPGFLKKLFATQPPPQPQAQEPDREIIKRLRELMAERSRVQSLIYEEKQRVEALGEQARQRDEDRIEALTASRLSGQDADSQQAATLFSEATALRREIEESSAVATRLSARVDELNASIKAHQWAYKQAEAKFLDDLYKKSMEAYNALAPGVAQAVLRVAAVRRVMMRRLVGNTNGWNGQILLPGMVPREGRYIAAILDGSDQQFAIAADALEQSVRKELCAAGFIYDKF